MPALRASSSLISKLSKPYQLASVKFFSRAYDAFGFDGCSSHSGRRSFVTGAARAVSQSGRLAAMFNWRPGADHHKPRHYIDGDVQRRLVT